MCGSWFYPQGKQDSELVKMAKGCFLTVVIFSVITGVILLCAVVV